MSCTTDSLSKCNLLKCISIENKYLLRVSYKSPKTKRLLFFQIYSVRSQKKDKWFCSGG